MLTLDALAGTLQECGCCPPPLCCAPLVECQTGITRLKVTGFVKPLDDSDSVSDELEWLRPHYQKLTVRNSRNEVVTTTDVFPGMPPTTSNGGATYTSETYDYNWIHDSISQYPDSFEVAPNADWFKICVTKESVPVLSCTITGGYTRTSYGAYATTAAGPPAVNTWHTYVVYEQVVTYEDVGGDETEEHIAWVAIYTDDANWQVEHAAWVVAHAEWEAWDALRQAHDTWEADPVGEEPPEEGAEPPNPDEPSSEPGEFYLPCTLKVTTVSTSWELVGGVVVLVEDTAESPNPLTTHDYAFDPGESNREELYTNEITYAAWLAACDAWHSTVANFDDISGSDEACFPSPYCRAIKVLFRPVVDWAVAYQWFRYRFKLNKCCAWKSIRSEWDEILYRQEWLDWKAIMDARGDSESTPDPVEPSPEPVKTAKAWEWTGTPPLCPDASSLSSDAPPVDPYDHEPMWSPWSLVVKMPAGEIQGVILNRNYQQKCYEAPPQQMPEIFGTYDDSRSV